MEDHRIQGWGCAHLWHEVSHKLESSVVEIGLGSVSNAIKDVKQTRLMLVKLNTCICIRKFCEIEIKLQLFADCEKAVLNSLQSALSKEPYVRKYTRQRVDKQLNEHH